MKLNLKISQVRLKLKQTSTKLKLKFEREVHYFFRGGSVVGWLGGWCGRMENKAISAFDLVEVEAELGN